MLAKKRGWGFEKKGVNALRYVFGQCEGEGLRDAGREDDAFAYEVGVFGGIDVDEDDFAVDFVKNFHGLIVACFLKCALLQVGVKRVAMGARKSADNQRMLVTAKREARD